MDIAFIVDPLPSLKAYKDSSVAMMRVAYERGHGVWALEQHDLFFDQDVVRMHATPLALKADDDDWYLAGEAALRTPESFGAILMRKDPPFDMEYVYSTYLLEAAESQGARVFNRPRSIRDHNEKMAITRFPEFTAPTRVSRDETLLREFIAQQRDTILKPLDGMGGASVFRVREGDPNVNVIIETLNRFGKRTVMAQRYIPEIVDGDKRILVIAGEPVPYALARIPRAGETRGNLAAGGRGVARELSAHDREIATALGPLLWEAGLLIVGLDVIGDYLTEINVTSPTCFVEIGEQTGFDVAGMLVDALERTADAPLQALRAAGSSPNGG
jgi:glutathione synthase